MKTQEEIYNIILEYEPLVRSIASNFFGTETEDLLQAGRLGLINANRNYVERDGSKFSSYAYNYIFGEMYTLSIINKTIKLNKDSLKLYKKIQETKNHIYQKIGIWPSNTDIALYLSIDEEIIFAIESAMNVISLSMSVNDDDSTLYDVIPDKNQVNIDERLMVSESISKLKKLEQKVIDYRYFKDFTQSETAKVLCMSQAKVSRYEKNSLNKMRGYIAA